MLSIDWSAYVLYFVLYVFCFKFGMHFIFSGGCKYAAD